MTILARERFLSQTSVSLQDSIPSLAQQLRLSLQSLQNINGSSNRTNPGECCPVCGSRNVELKTVEVRRTNNNAQNSSSVAAEEHGPCLDIYRCQTCSRSVKMPVQESKPDPAQKSMVPTGNASVDKPNAIKDRDSKVQKTSSKKRAKDRKDRQGLQALLSKKPDSPRPVGSFDLMDFMASKT